MAVSWDRYGWWRKLEIVRWVSRRALDAVGGVLATFDECPMVLPEPRMWTAAKLERGAVSRLLEFGHCRKRVLKNACAAVIIKWLIVSQLCVRPAQR